MVGQTIARYEILEQLGSGGMGVVYKARDQRLDRLVALKFLPPELSKDEEANARFMQEARAASALDHPSICTIHDIRETEEGRLFIVMAFYEGQTLKYRLNDGSFEPDEAAEIVRQVAEGLAAAHEAGIVHRDIKPANIMVTDKGLVKILDFGIAKLTGGLDLTKTGGTVGTAYYMSPEQIKGEQADHRTDLWALGVVLYQMLTGKRPFEGEYEQAVSYAILHQEPADLPADVPETLSRLCAKLLAKDPAERLQNASDILTEMGMSRADAALRSARRTKGSLSRKQWMAIGMSSALVTAVLLLLAITQLSRSGDEGSTDTDPVISDNTIAVMPFSVGGEELAYLDESMVDLLSLGMQGAGDLHTVDPNTILGFLGEDRSVARNPERAREVAADLGAGRFVLGSVTQLGPQVRINASLYDHEGQLLQQAEARAPSEEHLAGMVDTLVVQLIAGQVADPLKEFVPLATQMTSSYPALKAYLRGELAYRQGNYGEGAEAFREAVRLDSTFAMAWDRITDWNPSQEAYEHARRYRDKLPEREQMLLDVRLKIVFPDTSRVVHGLPIRPATGPPFEEVTREFQTVVERYPDFSRGWFRLGDWVYHNAYGNGRLTSESREHLERALQLDPNNAEVLFHLIQLATMAREFDVVDSLLARYPDRALEGSELIISHTLSALWRGDEREVDSTLIRLTDRNPTAITLAAIGAIQYLEDVPAGLRLVGFWLQDKPSKADGLLLEGLAEAARGRFRASDSLLVLRLGERPWGVLPAVLSGFCLECPVREDFIRTLQEAIARLDTTPGSFPLHRNEETEVKAYLNGQVSYILENETAFQEARKEVERIAIRKGDGSLAHSMARMLEALSRWRDGDVTGALETIRQAIGSHDYGHKVQSPLYNHTLARYLRAEFLFAEGRFEEALPWFASLREGPFILVWPLPFLGPSLLRRAEIHEQLGDRERAMDFYSRFIKLWQDADPELQPLVEQARRRLDRLIEAGLREPQPDVVAR